MTGVVRGLREGTWRGPRWDVRTGTLFAVVAIGYAVGSKSALELAEASGLQSVFFIPAGITVAALLRVRRRQWWAVLAAAALAEFLLDVSDGYPADVSAGFVLANVVEPLVGALVVARLVDGPIDLARRRHVFAFVAGAVVVGPVVGGLLGATADVVFGDVFWPTWWQWALGDALGVVIVGSGILVWGSSPDRRSLASAPGVLLLGASVATTAVAFLTTDLPVTFIVVVGIVVAGVVFGARAVAMSALVVAGATAFGLAVDTQDLMAGVVDSTALVLIKAQLGLYTVAGLVVAAEAFEAELATWQAAQLEHEARYRGTFENAGVGMAHVSPDGRWLRVNHRLCEILGFEQAALLGTTYHAIAEPEDLETDRENAQQLLDGVVDDVTIEKRCVRYDGTRVWTSMTTSVVRTPAGDPDYFITVVEDVSARKEAERTLREQEAAERHARERAELLAEMVEQLERVDGLEGRATRLAELLVATVADYVSVEAPDQAEPVVALAHRDPAMLPTLRRLRAHHRLQQDHEQSVARAAAGAAQLVGEVTPELRAGYARSPEIAALLEHLALRSHMAVPIDLGGDVPGVLLLGRSDPERPLFTEDDLGFVRAVARRAGVVLTAAWLRDEEHRISVRLQRTLLPAVRVANADVAVAARYESGSDQLEVGGDWYDVIERPEGELVAAVGDVVGHGLDAAATMGRLRSAFAAYTAHTDRPGRLLADLDRFAHGPGAADFTTVCCAVLDPASGQLRYASAGHPPVLVCSADGTTRWLDDARSVPLCTIPVEHRAEASVVLQPGDLVVLYSDGLVERRGEPLSVGLARLEAAVRGVRDRSVDEVCDDLVATLTDPSARPDDAVVVALRFTPVAVERFRRVFLARADQLPRIRSSVRAWLHARGYAGRLATDVLIGVGEACANAIEHAYGGSGTGEVEIELGEDADAGLLHVRIRDRGVWRPSDGRGDEHRGRGTLIMRAVSDDYARHTGPEGTVVTMRIPLVADGRPPARAGEAQMAGEERP